MSTSFFKAEDWVYVPDSMGRLGQGYYKNRSNPSQTITPAEFEQRRAQPQPVVYAQKEQNINTLSNPSPTAGNDALLSATSTQATDLTPWDNPLIGEQTATTPISQSTTQAKNTATIQVKQSEPQTKAAPNPNQGGGEGNSGNGYDAVEIGRPDDADNANGSNSGAGKVICTELVRQGLMRQSERRACTLYALSCLPSQFMIGYQFWAVPYVRLMRKSSLATQLIAPLVRWRTLEVCYRLGLRKSGSLPGKILCALHDPFCTFIGFFVPSTNYSTLYQQEILS